MLTLEISISRSKCLIFPFIFLIANHKTAPRSSLENHEDRQSYSRSSIKDQVDGQGKTFSRNESSRADEYRKKKGFRSRIWQPGCGKLPSEKEHRTEDSPVAFWASSCRLCVARFRRKSSSTLVVLEDRVPGFSDRWLSAEIEPTAVHTTDPHDSLSPLKDARAYKP